MSEGLVVIKKGREKPIIQQHPWIFSGAIAHVENAEPGGTVTVQSHDGTFLARGYWNTKSQIQVRILTWKDEPIGESWWREMLQRAIQSRSHLNKNPTTTAYRLVNAESDYLPGLIVDTYGDSKSNKQWLVIQALTLGINIRKEMIANLLIEMLNPQGIYERSDVDVREKEGLQHKAGVLWGDEPPMYIHAAEESVTSLIDVRNGHKTGSYLDQRENRQLLGDLIEREYQSVDRPCRVLNLFSYTGGFGKWALVNKPDVSVINVDSSKEALELAEQSYFDDKDRAEYIMADVFEYLRDQARQGEQFDIIVLDPPKFAHSQQQVDKAERGYKDINLNAFKLIKPGGYLMTFSCSGAITPDLFQKIVFGALADANRQAQIIKHLTAGEDHPVALTFPEGAYLKGLLLKVY